MNYRNFDIPAVGIDFGTTNSKLCYKLRDGEPKILQIRQLPYKERQDKFLPYLPGYIFFPGKNQVIIGESARKFFYLKPHRVVRSIKKNLEYSLKIGNRTYTSVRLAQYIFEYLLNEYKHIVGKELSECVLTVPSTFGHRQRIAIMKALESAGKTLKRVYILDEPIAAFIAYQAQMAEVSISKGGEECEELNVLLVDVGGGTTDLGVLKCLKRGGNFEVSPLAVWSNLKLGGDDFDTAIASSIINLREEKGLLKFSHLTDSEKRFLLNEFLIVAESIKRSIQKPADKIEILISGLGGEKRQSFEVTWEWLNDIFSPLLKELRESINYVLERAKLNSDDINSAVLTGGMSNCNAIKRLIETIFPGRLVAFPEPQNAVATGACLYHHSILTSELLPGRIKPVSPVLTMALLMRIAGKNLFRLLPSCTPLPAGAKFKGKFSTPGVPVSFLRIPFYQGDDNGKEVWPIATLTLSGKKPFSSGTPVEIEISVDINKIIYAKVTAKPFDRDDYPDGRIEKTISVWGL